MYIYLKATILLENCYNIIKNSRAKFSHFQTFRYYFISDEAIAKRLKVGDFYLKFYL